MEFLKNMKEFCSLGTYKYIKTFANCTKLLLSKSLSLYTQTGSSDYWLCLSAVSLLSKEKRNTEYAFSASFFPLYSRQAAMNSQSNIERSSERTKMCELYV